MLRDQLRRARKALEFSYVPDSTPKEVTRDHEGRARIVYTVGHQAARYQVILRRQAHSISVECREDTALGYIPCPSGGVICYHALAAVMLSCQEQGYSLIVNSHQSIINKLSNLGGIVFTITSFRSGHILYALGRPQTNLSQLEAVA